MLCALSLMMRSVIGGRQSYIMTVKKRYTNEIKQFIMESLVAHRSDTDKRTKRQFSSMETCFVIAFEWLR